MAEHGLLCESMRAGAPLVLGSVTLIPVERRRMLADTVDGMGAWFSAHCEACALIVRNGDGQLRAIPTAFGEDAGTTPGLSLETLRAQVPGLAELLASM